MKWITLVLVSLLFLLQYRLWFGKNSIPDYIAYSQQVTEQQQHNSGLKQRNSLLIADIQDLKLGVQAMEERARNELGLIKQGETFFQFSPRKSNPMLPLELQFTVVVPAAGVGKRMAADRPKQYLLINGKTVLQHTLEKLITHPNIQHIVVAVHPQDCFFDDLPCSHQNWLTRVDGGSERADSVLAGLNLLAEQRPDWVLVHDAARPCVSHAEITQLLSLAVTGQSGGILASPVRDTMKRATQNQPNLIDKTIDRDGLWHALTPQFFPFKALQTALSDALHAKVAITDEASAMEWAGHPVQLIESSDKNIKITRPDDLTLAAFYLSLENV